MDTQVTPPNRSRVKKVLVISLLVLIVSALVYYFICGMTYSEGTRSGILNKVSRKGFVFKTYEGELSVGGMNQGEGTMVPATNFIFSVTDRKVYQRLEDAQGKKVVVHYRQVIKNFFWQGETDYFVTDVQIVK